MKNRKWFIPLAAIAVLLVSFGAIALFPPVTERLAWHINQWQVRIRYALNPPEEAIFVPQEQVEAVVQATLGTSEPQAPTLEATPVLQATLVETELPTVTPTSLPEEFKLEGVRYEDQHGAWNYCAPANLSMALSYWGWEGSREDTGSYLKPNGKDKNVMPYEMANFVEEATELGAIVRYGGTVPILKSLIAAGFPVVVEKGVYIRESTTGKVSWMGHYNILTGYDDTQKIFYVQDSYFEPDYPIEYEQLVLEWRSMNYVFLVVYAPDRWDRLQNVLGVYSDETESVRLAYQIASDELTRLTDNELYFAWFNLGTNLRRLQDYSGAADAFDESFQIYAALPEDSRPWRMLWYQTDPYFAYYYMGRYQDVINLADQTLDIHEPILEESYFWRARAKYALGDREGAIEDLQTSLDMHQDFVPSVDLLQSLGVTD
jgi:hypothetical protein